MTKKKQTANTKQQMTDFEELTSLTALIDPQNQEPQPPNQTIKPQKQTKKQTKPKKKPSSKLKPKKSYATPKEAGETPSKVMTSIIISEDVRDWLRIQSITTKQSMSQQIEELVKKEMKKTKSI